MAGGGTAKPTRFVTHCCVLRDEHQEKTRIRFEMLGNMDDGVIKCEVTVEHVAVSGATIRKDAFKSAHVELGRNELEDVVLKISHDKGTLGPYTLRTHTIHKKFLRNGKATICLGPQGLQIMLSNCPPQQLGLFLRLLSVKVAARGNKQGAKRRVIGDVSLNFDTISPLNENDVKKAQASNGGLRVKDTNKSESALTTPKRKALVSSVAVKRKLQSDGSGAQQPRKKSNILGGGAELNEQQQAVINSVRIGLNVFITGGAGTGKSYLLRKMISTLPPDVTFVTASTGAAACHIGGTTLHAFAGIGSGTKPLDQCKQLAARRHYAAQWRKCRHLIIDEVSMVDADYFDKMEAVARTIRKNRQPFGGIQLILCGDFLQLPPVTKDRSSRKYCFQAKCWRDCIDRSVELTKVHRQNDPIFIAMLQQIRLGRCPPEVVTQLQKTATNVIEKDGIQATKLFTHTSDVEATNVLKLSELPGEQHDYDASDSDPSMREHVNTVCPAVYSLGLKVGAQVMLIRNMDVSHGLVNGARGVVTGFSGTGKGFPVIRFVSGVEKMIGYEKFVVRGSGGAGDLVRRQLPLKLAWAMSVHKSQGATLDCVEMSLSRVFEDGQAYVALSRARSLATLRVVDFTSSCIRADSTVVDYYMTLKKSQQNFIEHR